MKYWCATLLFIILPFLGRSANVDSLHNLLQQKNIPINDKIAIKLELGNHFYFNDGVLDSSLNYFQEALKLSEKAKNIDLMAKAWCGIGLIYREQGVYAKALSAYLQGHDLAQKANNPIQTAKALNGMAVVNAIQNDIPKAIELYQKALSIYKKNHDLVGQASILNNLGLAYSSQKLPLKALKSYEEALKINEQTKEIRNIAINCENIGLIYLNDLKNIKRSIEQFNKSLAIWRELKDNFSVSVTLGYLASALYSINKFDQCIDTASLSLQLGIKSNSLVPQKEAHELLYKCYEKKNNTEKAFFHLKEFIRIKNEMINEEKIREITEMQTTYELNKQKTLDSLKTEAKYQFQSEQQKIKFDQQKKFNTLLTIALFITLILIGVVMLVLLRHKKARIEIANQKVLIEQRNHEVMDSIRYASHIQRAILPPEEQLSKALQDHFVLYKPKDIVSGDFYWIEEKKDYTFFAVVDCTGHGVPGAFMSIVGRNALNDAVNIAGLTESNKILDYVNQYVNDTLHQHYDKSRIRDGMDMSLCVWNKKNNTIDFSGANNPLWLKRKDAIEMEEFEGDKQPIGNFIENQSNPFTVKQIQVTKGDMIYLFSDGYADQFGGEKGKKLKYKNFKKILLSIWTHPIESQAELLERKFIDWRGDLEQLDDVCVLGVKI